LIESTAQIDAGLFCEQMTSHPHASNVTPLDAIALPVRGA
jgi:hypothetical protein